jgi:hypothetical protein
MLSSNTQQIRWAYDVVMPSAANAPDDSTESDMPPERSPHSGGFEGAKRTQAQLRTQFLIESVGGVTRLASMLHVSKSQPSRWGSGAESPGPEAGRLLIDLDHVMARAQLLWAPQVATTWLNSPNAFLDGARPVDVLRTRGSGDVIQALDATMSGAIA